MRTTSSSAAATQATPAAQDEAETYDLALLFTLLTLIDSRLAELETDNARIGELRTLLHQSVLRYDVAYKQSMKSFLTETSAKISTPLAPAPETSAKISTPLAPAPETSAKISN